MTYEEIKNIISQGEGMNIEFKKSTTDITKDVYETVCAFSNREGGHILLSVKDDGTVIGVDRNCAERIRSDFVTSINNPNKMYPPLYLTIENIEYDDKLIIYIFVPESTQVCRCGGRIFDRNNDSDIDITNSGDLVFKLYSKKQGTYFVNKVFTCFTMDDLRSDIIDRARRLSRLRNKNHPWLTMTDEEILRSSGLILKDSEKGVDGLTLAAILLFGKDETIMAALPQHKTDAILREIFSNSIAHRDYSTGYVAKFVIEKDRMYTENGNLSHGHGELKLDRFEPFSKNPPIAKVFREVSLADELGSGMRNTYKYTKMYSGGFPEFIEGDVFKTIIPLSSAATSMVGPSTTQDTTQVNTQVATQDKVKDAVYKKILEFCADPKSKKEIAEYFQLKSAKEFGKRYLKPLIDNGCLEMTIPDKPTSSKQKYVTKK